MSSREEERKKRKRGGGEEAIETKGQRIDATLNDGTYKALEEKVKSMIHREKNRMMAEKKRNDNNNKPMRKSHGNHNNSRRNPHKRQKLTVEETDRTGEDAEEEREEEEEDDDDDDEEDEEEDEEEDGVQQTKMKKAPASVSSSSVVPPEAAGLVNGRTVYVQGLPFDAGEDDLRRFFSGVGEVRSVRLPRWHDSSRLKGYGHVEFATEKAAEKALELDGNYLGDRYLSVQRPLVPRSLSSSSSATTQPTPSSSSSHPPVRPPGCRTIFVRNLPYEIEEEEVRKAFMVYGPIVSVRLAVWNHTANLKGFGYVEFKREDSAEVAVKKSGSLQLKGRAIAVDYETRGPKAGYKGMPGKTHSKK